MSARLMVIGALCLLAIALLLLDPWASYAHASRMHRIVAPSGFNPLASQWFGSPALWQQPATDATVYFYDVSGGSQTELEDAMLAAHICDRYGGCLPDPGNPSTGALALQGETPVRQICYSPRSLALPWAFFIVLPRWTPFPGSVSTNTVMAWNALLAVIWTHEAHHLAIAEADLEKLNVEAETLPSCAAVASFYQDPHLLDQLKADQNAYHAELRADCRPELGCVPYGWMGW